MASPKYLWLNGELTEWDRGVIHVGTDAVLRGSNVFEGVRAYRSRDNLLLFRLDEHLDRLFNVSMRVLRMTLPWDADDLRAATIETLRANEIQENAHIRIVSYFGTGKENSFDPSEIETGAFILTLPIARRAAADTGVRCNISHWRRIADTTMPPRVKAGPNYLNSRLASSDSRLKGFDMPILLNERGRVAEGAAQCIFMVRGGVLVTPRITDGILESITRATVLELAGELGIPAEEREIDPSELYVAEEAFFAGSAAEILPIREVDNYPLNPQGRIVKSLQASYAAVCRGENPLHSDWVTSVYGAGELANEQPIVAAPA